MKTELEILQTKAPILAVNYIHEGTVKMCYILDISESELNSFDLDKNFIKILNKRAIETYQRVEHLTNKSSRTTMAYAVFPSCFYLRVEAITRINYYTMEDPEYDKLLEMLTGIFAKRSGLAVPVKKEIEIATS